MHNFDTNSRYNLLFGLSACQCLMLRIRSIFKRFQKAKINRYKYKELNIAELEIAYANEFRCSHKKCFIAMKQVLFDHQCSVGSSLSDKTRDEVLIKLIEYIIIIKLISMNVSKMFLLSKIIIN